MPEDIPVTEVTNEPEHIESLASSVQDKLASESLPIRAYLDQTVVPVLLEGMTALCRNRPGGAAAAIEFLGTFLLKKAASM
ncbi:hypothetical protein PCE1_004527 [Barthelona sp. PCE]